MRLFEYTTPGTIQQAVSALGANSRALAGGTDLLTLMKADIAAPERLVNVKMLLPRGIEARPEGLEIGALTTLAEIEQHPVIAAGYSAPAQAAALAASPQIRNLATIGGNLLQRPRCWYYRNARIDCWLKGGADCPAREGENRSQPARITTPTKPRTAEMVRASAPSFSVTLLSTSEQAKSEAPSSTGASMARAVPRFRSS